MQDPNVVRIFDTTLRDGEQSPGATMTRKEKLHIARRLDDLGVDVIEAGFPAASRGEVLAVQEIARVVKRAEVAGLCRTRPDDIRTAWEAVGGAKKPRLHVFIATSDIHLEHKLQMTRAQVLDEIRAGVTLCKSLCPTVEYSAEDSTRSDPDFLLEAFSVAIASGATVLNVPDTVGYTMPDEYRRLIESVVALVGGRDIIVSAHCHDDLGLAVANSLAAVAGGARQVECTINGIGERAGNAALEEIVMALHTRRELVGVETRIDTRQLLNASRLVSETTGMVVQPNKAVVGRNAFAHEAGIHQHGVLKNALTYEIMRPSDVGFADSALVLGKHSGRHALRDKLEKLGYGLDEEQLKRVFVEFKALCDKKKQIYEEDLHALVADSLLEAVRYFELERIEFSSGSDVTPTARASVRVNGQSVTASAEGDGPVNAAIEAIKRCTGLADVRLTTYHLAAVTGGSDAQGRVHVHIEWAGRVSRGQATHTDVVVASAEAYVDALNHHMYQEQLRELSTNGNGNGSGGAHGDAPAAEEGEAVTWRV
jgi:2-isopropylmalate synthase